MHARVRTARLALVVLFVTAPGILGAQNPPNTPSQLTFRSSADYVQVTVQARDRNGRAVDDLTAGDLQLFEDGKLQEIATLSSVNLPIERRQGARAAKNVATVGETAWASNATASEGRAFVLFVDAMHIAAERTIPARRLLAEFVTQSMGDNDIAAVVVSGGLMGGQNFTGDKASLLAAIDKITGDRLPSRMLTKWRHRVMLPYDHDIRDDYAGQRANRAQQSLVNLRRVVQMLTSLRGRRTAVLFVSEGLDVDLFDRIGQVAVPHVLGLTNGRDSGKDTWSNTLVEAGHAGQIADELQLTVEASTRSNVAIYTMDPRGLTNGEEENIQIAGMQSDTQVDPFLPTSLFRAESLRMQQHLRDLAGRTGGRAIVNTNNFKEPMAAIIDDASHYYVLTYQMAHKDDGRFHQISVKSARPGVTLSARDGYYSPRAGAATHTARSPLAALLESPIQLPGLTMSAASTVIPGTGKSTVRFAVEFNGAEFGGTAGAPPVIELAYVLTDDDGQVLSQGEKVLTLAVSREMRASLADNGLRYVGELSAPAGRHHVRLAAQNRGSQALGSLFWDVDVPVVPPTDVAVSPLVLSSDGTDAMPTINDAARGSAPDSRQKASSANGLMTARRAFGAQDVLSISTLVANGLKAGEPLTAAFVVSTDAGQEVARKDVAMPTANPSELAAFSQRVSLDSLAPGRYRADFVVRSSNGTIRAQRALVFEVL